MRVLVFLSLLAAVWNERTTAVALENEQQGETNTSMAGGSVYPIDLKATLTLIEYKLSGIEESLESLSKLDVLETALKELSRAVAAMSGRLDFLPRFLGYPCEADDQCSRFIAHTECGGGGGGGERRCRCADGYEPVPGSVQACRASGIGGPCSSDAQCQAQIDHTVCDRQSRTCRCGDDFWAMGDDCYPRKRLRDMCTRDEDCSAGTLRGRGACVDAHCACAVTRHDMYEYRLGNSTEDCSDGRVELRRLPGGSWGYVCDDRWGRHEANVVCESLGFSGGGRTTANSRFGGSDEFHLDDLACSGNETHLMECGSRGWGVHNCNAREVAGVICLSALNDTVVD